MVFCQSRWLFGIPDNAIPFIPDNAIPFIPDNATPFIPDNAIPFISDNAIPFIPDLIGELSRQRCPVKVWNDEKENLSFANAEHLVWRCFSIERKSFFRIESGKQNTPADFLQRTARRDGKIWEIGNVKEKCAAGRSFARRTNLTITDICKLAKLE